MITAAQIKKVSPRAKDWIVKGIVDNQGLMLKHGIDTPLRVQHFFAQCALETGGFTQLEENLSYSAKRMTQVWPSRFKSIAAAKPYERNPEALANKVYGGRLGNNSSGDGWKYRGSGMKQLTGKYNYEQFKKSTGIDVVSSPQILRQFPGAMESACIFWAKNRLSRFADADDIVGLTKAINGGTTGLADRRAYLKKTKQHITTLPGRAAPSPAPLGPLPEELSSIKAPVERAPTVAAAPAPSLEIDETVAKHVQTLLREKGYFSAGPSDGDAAGRTQEAILAFRNENGLPLVNTIDREFVEALEAAPKRYVAPEQATATTAAIRKDETAPAAAPLRQTWYQKAIAVVVAIPAAISAAFSGIFEYFGDATEKLDPVKDFLGDVPMWVWGGMAASVALVIWLSARNTEKPLVEMTRKGQLV